MDAKGRPTGYRNLEQLADRIGPVMLRRRKEEVESQLPGRTTKTFFVPMTDTQQAVYDDYEFGVRRLAAIARRRPLIKEEYERLQKFLACMRMVCDTPTILDGQRHECPKLDEIERLLPELLSDSQRKILIFSEWIRMLELVREQAVAAGIEFAWHTGSVPQIRRRAEIRRFRSIGVGISPRSACPRVARRSWSVWTQCWVRPATMSRSRPPTPDRVARSIGCVTIW